MPQSTRQLRAACTLELNSKPAQRAWDLGPLEIRGSEHEHLPPEGSATKGEAATKAEGRRRKHCGGSFGRRRSGGGGRPLPIAAVWLEGCTCTQGLELGVQGDNSMLFSVLRNRSHRNPSIVVVGGVLET